MTNSNFWLTFILNGLFFGGFLLSFFDSKPEETSSFVLFQFYPKAPVDNTPSQPHPPQTNHTSTPTESNTTSPSQPTPTNLTGPITPTPNSTIQLWQYNSKVLTNFYALF